MVTDRASRSQPHSTLGWHREGAAEWAGDAVIRIQYFGSCHLKKTAYGTTWRLGTRVSRPDGVDTKIRMEF